MLTRLKVDGFKNLVDVDLRFGPFTCIAGGNGVGKSNVFDAISFLSDLADVTFAEAIAGVRTEGGDRLDGEDASGVDDVFYRGAKGGEGRARFECEFLVTREGEDDLGQLARAKSTFLRYTLELKRRDDDPFSANPLELVYEHLTYIRKGEARQALPFASTTGEWFESIFLNERTGGPYITTDREKGRVLLHQDGRNDDGKKKRGRAVERDSLKLPRTVLSSATASESPTVLLARREFRSWRRLQLEASALRRSDRFTAESRLGEDGAHMAKTLYTLIGKTSDGVVDEQDATLLELSSRVGELVDDVHRITVDVDERRQRLTLIGIDDDGIPHSARALSDGTLRFLALAVLELDVDAEVICLEEPENGIHPTRIEAMVRLLRDIAMDVSLPLSDDNPLRQVIVNTHSPGVVRACSPDSVVVVERQSWVSTDTGRRSVRFPFLPETWRHRADPDAHPAFLGDLLAFLEFQPRVETDDEMTRVEDYVEDQLKLAID